MSAEPGGATPAAPLALESNNREAGVASGEESTGKPSRALEVSIQAEAGVYFNAANPPDGRNFGQLFHDHANELQLNQILLTISRAPNVSSGGYGLGFNLQAMYGSDARYDQIVGFNDDWIGGRNQIAISQANVTAHLPWATQGGIDLKAGILPGTMGIETLDPSLRPFYSLSYTSNFLVPFQHVGVAATVHLSPDVDLFGQIDSGNQVALGSGDHNSAPAGYAGLVLHDLAQGRLSILATTRLGPELPRRQFPGADRQMRSWNDVSVLFNPRQDLSLGVEANYLHDEGLGADAYAVMAFATFRTSPEVSLSARAELYRDETGQFTALFVDDGSFIRSLAGKPARVVTAQGTTYGSWTIGASIRPAALQRFGKVIIRPEVRYDRSLGSVRPFNNLTDRDALMFGGDLIFGF